MTARNRAVEPVNDYNNHYQPRTSPTRRSPRLPRNWRTWARSSHDYEALATLLTPAFVHDPPDRTIEGSDIARIRWDTR